MSRKKEQALKRLIASGEVVQCLCGSMVWLKEFAPSVDPRCVVCRDYEAADPEGPSVHALVERRSIEIAGEFQ